MQLLNFFRLAAILLVAAGLHASAAPRDVLDLNGSWEYHIVQDLSPEPPASGWKPFAVPGMLRGHDYQRAWFRRTVTVPAAMRGQRVKLRFGGVKFNSRVLLNGDAVGGCFGGYEPFELDVTARVRTSWAWCSSTTVTSPAWPTATCRWTKWCSIDTAKNALPVLDRFHFDSDL